MLRERLDWRLFVSEVTTSFSLVTSARTTDVICSVLTAAMDAAVTSMTLLTRAASSSKLTVYAVEARTIQILPGMSWRKSSQRKE